MSHNWEIFFFLNSKSSSIFCLIPWNMKIRNLITGTCIIKIIFSSCIVMYHILILQICKFLGSISINIYWTLYWFSMAAIANHYQSWWLKRTHLLPNSSISKKSEMVQWGWVLLGGSRRESVFLSLWLLGTTLLVYGLFPLSSKSAMAGESFHITSL